jgi:hypothetical protein
VGEPSDPGDEFAERHPPVTAALDRIAVTEEPLAPVNATLRAMFGTSTELPGLAPDLLVTDPTGWTPSARLAGDALPGLLDSARRRWRAQPHAAAALAWKSYTYWLALPAVLGWASARRVPMLDPADVLIRFTDHRPFLTVGLRRASVAVLPSDPLVATCGPAARVVADEAELLDTLRATLLDAHLMPLLERIRSVVHIGQRTMLGSLASGVAYGLIRASDALPGSTVDNANTLLEALDVAELVSLVPGASGDLTVQRHTCCLAFTLPEPKVCSGCCIRA